MRPLISIVVPVYNMEKYLHKCVDSLLNQSYNQLEIILVNDGSTDHSAKICDEFAEKDSRIKVVHRTNGGLSEARNSGLSIFKGEYVTFVDSDDYVRADYVQTLLDLVLNYNVKIAVSQFKYVSNEHIDKDDNDNEKDFFLPTLEALENMFYQDYFDHNATAKLFHRSLFDSLKFPVDLLYEDMFTTYKILLSSDSGVAVFNKKTYYYLIRSDSIEGAPFSAKKLNSMRFIVDDFENTKKQYPVLAKGINCRLLSFIFHLLVETKVKSSEEKELFLLAQKYRKEVLVDNKARKKARLAAFVSYFGTDVLRFFYRFGKSRT